MLLRILNVRRDWLTDSPRLGCRVTRMTIDRVVRMVVAVMKVAEAGNASADDLRFYGCCFFYMELPDFSGSNH